MSAAPALRLPETDADELRAALRDIAMGAAMMLQPPFAASGAFGSYAKEVRRVAEAALGHEVRL